MKPAAMIFLVLAALGGAASSSFGQDPATESEWITYLAQFTGLQQGLAGPATIDRYVDILSVPGYIGIEAEKADFSSGISASRSLRYGQPSGAAWLEAKAGGGLASYRFTIPNRRDYIIEGRLRGGPQTWKIDDMTFEVAGPGEVDFEHRSRVGEVTLEAGEHEITVVLPPQGGLDRIDLITSGIPEIRPESGFRPREFLRYRLKAETIIRTINYLRLLPVLPNYYQLIEGEEFSRNRGDWTISRDSSPGSTTGEGWLRADGSGAFPEYILNLPENGIYRIRGRMIGTGRLIADFDRGRNRFFFPAEAPDEFAWTEVGTFYLPGGEHLISFELPPGAGLDVIEVTRLAAKPEDYLTLLLLLGFSEGNLEANEDPLGGGEVIELEPPEAHKKGLALVDTGKAAEDANGIAVGPAGDREATLVVAVRPEETSHYSILLRLSGEKPVPFVIRDKDGRILDQRLVFPEADREMKWIPVVGNIPLDEEQDYLFSFSLRPGTLLDALRLLPAIFPWEDLREMVDREVYREGAEKNLFQLLERFGEEVTTETGKSPTEPEDEQEEDEEKEFGPASPQFPEFAP